MSMRDDLFIYPSVPQNHGNSADKQFHSGVRTAAKELCEVKSMSNSSVQSFQPYNLGRSVECSRSECLVRTHWHSVPCFKSETSDTRKNRPWSKSSKFIILYIQWTLRRGLKCLPIAGLSSMSFWNVSRFSKTPLKRISVRVYLSNSYGTTLANLSFFVSAFGWVSGRVCDGHKSLY